MGYFFNFRPIVTMRLPFLKVNSYFARVVWVFGVILLPLQAALPEAANLNDAPQARAIPFAQLGAEAQKQYSGTGIGVTSTADGARLRAAFQKLEAEATAEGLWIESTETAEQPERFCLRAMKVGQASSLPGQPGRLHHLPATGAVHASGEAAAWMRPGVVEEYSASMDGIRQDFVVGARPPGAGGLRLELEVNGARVETASYGAKLTLDGSGRELAYSRLHVTDADGKELAARMKVTAENRLLIEVDDSAAVYPVRIDPTFSDADWISMGAVPTTDTVYAIEVDALGNLYIGGDFLVVGDVEARYVAKWDGDTWSALGSGVDNIVRALAVTATDLYVGGDFNWAGGPGRNRLAKWTLGGVNDSAWSSLGAGVSNTVRALAVTDTDLYVGGSFVQAGRNRIARWPLGGSSWSALGSGVDGQVNALAVNGTDLYVGGFFTAAGGVPGRNRLAKWTLGGADDSAWSALGSGVDAGVHVLAANDTDLYVGGSFTSAGGTAERNRIAKWTLGGADDSAWSALGTGTSGTVNALAVTSTDLYIGGNFSTVGGVGARSGVAKWALGGVNDSAWSALGSGVGGTYALAVSGANLYVGGEFTIAGGARDRNRIAKWALGGTNDTAWSSVGSGVNRIQFNALAVSGADLYAGGAFFIAGEINVRHLVKWDGSVWSPLGSGVNGMVSALTVRGTNLYVGGEFTEAGGVSGRNHVAKWMIGGVNDEAWSALGSGVGDKVHALATTETDLYVGGAFTEAGGVSGRNHIAKWALGGADDGAWSALGAGVSSTVHALTATDTDLYVGGGFTMAGGASGYKSIAKWTLGGVDNSDWHALGSGVTGSVYALTVAGADLYVGGVFGFAGGVAGRSFIAKWELGGTDNSAWSSLGSGVIGTVYALTATDTDLYVGGDFGFAGGVSSRRQIARWALGGTDDSAWSSLGSGVNGVVLALAASDAVLNVGGTFASAGGNQVRCISSWTLGGEDDDAWISPLHLGMNNEVLALAISGSNLYAGGSFTRAGGVAVNCIAKWDGHTWRALGSGINGTVRALLVSGEDLYVGGTFTTAGGVAANNIAKWNGNTWSALGSGTNAGLYALAMAGTELYAGGFFTEAGAVTGRNHIARWSVNGTDDSSWSALGSGVNNTVRALAVMASDLYVGGNFSAAGGKQANHIAKWALNGIDDGSWSALGGGVQIYALPTVPVNALAVSGADLYVGGTFDTVGNNMPVSHIAKWDGSSWSALGSGTGGTVSALAVSGPYLYVGGVFSNVAGGVSGRRRIAVWTLGGTDDTAWIGMGSGMDDTVRALAAKDGRLYAGGRFTMAGGKSSARLARAEIGVSEILVTGNDVEIVNGDMTPEAADHTDFGGALVAGGAVARTFTIANTGTVYLRLTCSPLVKITGPHAADFTVTAQPLSPVAVDGSTAFTITFDPVAAGLRSATVSIENDDEDESLYVFAIQGIGLPGIGTGNDRKTPTLKLASPAGAAISTTLPFRVAGTAVDNIGVDRVEVVFNGGAPMVAALGASTKPGTVPFSADILPEAGDNTLTVTAYDANGNSVTVTRSFTFERRYLLTLQRDVPANQAASPDKAGIVALKAAPTKNASKFSAGPAPQTSQVLPGTAVTLTAIAKSGHLFSHWSGLPGGAQVAGHVISFAMPAADVPGLTAVFLANPFLTEGSANPFPGLGSKAVFQGLLQPDSGTAASNSTVGWFTATMLASKGSLSGKVLLDGKTTSYRGVLQGDGSVWFKSGKSLLASLPLLAGTTTGKSLSASWSEAGLHAEVSAPGNALSEGLAQPAIYSKTGSVPAALLGGNGKPGYYTLVFPAKSQTPSKDPADYPQGTGYATLTLTKTGVVKLAGVLADGTRISASSFLVAGDASPLFVPLRTPGGKSSEKDGSFSGVLMFDATAPHSDAGGVDWRWFRPVAKTKATAVQAYRAGWSGGIRLDPIGALYDAAIPAQTALGLGPADANNGNAVLSFEDGKLVAPLVKNLNVEVGRIVKRAGDSSYTLTLAAKTGLMKGSFEPNWSNPARKRPAFQGVLLQKGANRGGFGFFISNAAADPAPESGQAILQAP